MSERVFVLGAGRVGLGLARAFRAAGVEVVGVHGRRNSGGEDRVTTGAFPAALANASVCLVAVRDSQLEAALGELASAPLPTGTVVLHVSGSHDPVALGDLRRLGHPAGTFHPLLPLPDPERATRALRGAWIGVDGDVRARAAALELAGAIGARTIEIPAGEKARYHAAAVFASNFPLVLVSVAERLLVDSGVPAAAARAAARSLFLAAAENLRGSGHPDEVLTGPVVRGDPGTVHAHLSALGDDPDLLELYRLLSLEAVHARRRAGGDAASLEALTTLLSAARR